MLHITSLAHGGFSGHRTNWEFVRPLFPRHFTVLAIARRGRGEADATEHHSLEDESRHEGMTTAPWMYAEAVARVLLEAEAGAPRS